MTISDETIRRLISTHCDTAIDQIACEEFHETARDRLIVSAGNYRQPAVYQEPLAQNTFVPARKEKIINIALGYFREIIAEVEKSLEKGLNTCSVRISFKKYESRKYHRIEDVLRTVFCNTMKVDITESLVCQEYRKHGQPLHDRGNLVSALASPAYKLTEATQDHLNEMIIFFGFTDLRISWKYTDNIKIEKFLGNPIIKADPTEESERLNQFRKQGKHCDCILRVDGKDFHVHKAILARSSVPFDTMFAKQGANTDPLPYGLATLKAAVFEELLEFIYTGKCSVLNAPTQFIIDLAQLAHETQVTPLKNLCHQSLERSLSRSNFYTITKYAAALDDKELLKSCQCFLESNPGAVTMNGIAAMTAIELTECITIAKNFKSERFIHLAVIAIREKINKDSFKDFCQEATKTKLEELKNECYRFATANKELFKLDEMKQDREAYAKLMTGLD